MKGINKIAGLLAAALLLAITGCKLGGADPPEDPAGTVIHDDEVFAFGPWVNSGDFDVRLKKFDKDGVEDTVSWDKNMDHIDSEYAMKNVMAMDSSGSVYVAYAFLNPPTGYDWRIKKFDADGNEDTVNWDKILDGGMNNGHDWPTALVVDHSDKVYVIGYFQDGSDSLKMDWRIKKYDAGGTEITTGWNKIVDGGAAVSPDYPYAAAVDSSNNLYVTGLLYPASYVYAIKKYSSAGVEDTVNWNKTYTSGNFNSLTVDSADNLYIGGGTGSDLLVRKYSSAGVEDTVNWNKTMDVAGYDEVKAMAVDSGDNLFIAGTCSNATDSDWWIKKLSSGGTEITSGWDKLLDSGGEDFLYSIAVGGLDDVYVFGVSHDGDSAYNWVIKKYDQDGVEDTVGWDKSLAAAASSDAGLTILVDF